MLTAKTDIMEKKLLKYTCYLLLISLVFIGCMNEMEMIENEPCSKMNNERWFLPDPIKALIEYDKKSMSQYDINKVENILGMLYSFPETRDMLNSLANDGLKVKMEVVNGGSSVIGKAWYDPTYPPKIGFLRDDCITRENVLHEFITSLCYA